MAQEDRLELTSKMLNECETPTEIINLPAVEDRWIKTYEMTTGRKDGDLRFHAEKTLFMQTIAEDKNLAQCTPMSIYSSFILLAVSGLSLKDGESYLIPYGKKCTWMPGWKGRLEQINNIPGVKTLTEPICVYENEEFEFEVQDGNYVITKHKPQLNTKGQDILLVYANLIMHDGTKTVYLMRRDEVLSIRDRYSTSYNQYISKPANKDGKRVAKYKDRFTGEWKEFEIDPPMWVTDEAQAFKKTLIKRIYNTIPKSGTVVYIDNEIEKTFQDAEQFGEMDAEEIAKNVQSISQIDDSENEVEDGEYDDVTEVDFEEDEDEEEVKEQPKTKEKEVKQTVVEEYDEDDTF